MAKEDRKWEGDARGHEFGAGRGTVVQRDKRTKRRRTRKDALRKALREFDTRLG
ncbi:MAG: hypothetical protein WC965_01000 [Thiohalomonadaceae bacterium]